MNILGIGPMELLLIIVLALIVLGPEKLPQVMAQVGKAFDELRRATTQLSDEFNRTIQAELNETRSVVQESRDVLTDARSSVDEALAGTQAAIRGAPTLPPPARNEAVVAPQAVAEPDHTGPNESRNGVQWSWESAATPVRVLSQRNGTPDSSWDLVPPY